MGLESLYINFLDHLCSERRDLCILLIVLMVVLVESFAVGVINWLMLVGDVVVWRWDVGM